MVSRCTNNCVGVGFALGTGHVLQMGGGATKWERGVTRYRFYPYKKGGGESFHPFKGGTLSPPPCLERGGGGGVDDPLASS